MKTAQFIQTCITSSPLVKYYEEAKTRIAGKQTKKAILQTGKNFKISKEKALQIVSNHNCITIEQAKQYTNSELKEVLKQLKLKANF